MHLAFTKMHALGNDFVVIDAVNTPVTLDPGQVRALADRRRGVGCDQVLMLAPCTSGRAEFRYRIYNADGGEVAQCGNGARCVARYARARGLTTGNPVRLETAAGVLEATLHEDGTVTVALGVPQFEPAAIPFDAPARAPEYELDAGGTRVRIGAVSLGNPHAVLVVDSVETAPVAQLGPAIEHHPRFPERTNVGFMQILARDAIRLRVHERGAGETLACGSGACAAVACGIEQGRLDRRVRVALPGGELVVSWDRADAPVQLTGPAEFVFDGEIDV